MSQGDQPAHVPPPGPSRGEGTLRIGAYHIPLPSEAVLTWPQLCEITASGDLNDLNRHSNCENEYREWREPIKAQYGDLETYIRKVRLQWDEEEPEEVRERDRSLAYFRHDWGPDRVRCIPNDWPYGIPDRCGHYVVWCKSPMLHPSLFETDQTPFEPEERQAIYEAVAYDGVRGLTGGRGGSGKAGGEIRVVGMKTIQLLKSMEEVATAPTPAGSPRATPSPRQGGEDAATMAERAHSWAGREVDAYCKEKWPEDEWET